MDGVQEETRLAAAIAVRGEERRRKIGEEEEESANAELWMWREGGEEGGEGGIPPPALLPRSQSVNHLLHGSNGTVH